MPLPEPDEPGPDVLDTTEAGGRVIRGGAVRAVGYAASTLLSLLGIAVVARGLGTDDFGRFQTVVSLLAVVGAITDAGLSTLGLREYAQRHGRDRDALMRALIGLRLTLSVVGIAIAAGFAALAGYRPELVVGAVLQGVGLMLVVWQTTLTIPLQADLRLATVTALDLLRQAATTVSYVVLAAAGAMTVGAVLAVPVWVGLIVVAVTIAVVADRRAIPSFDLERWRGLLRVSAAFVLATSIGILYIYTAMLAMSFVADATETGLFAASFRIVVVVAGVPGLLVTAAFPLLSRAARDDADRFAYAVSRVAETTLLLGVTATVAIVAGAPAIIAVAAGPDFADAADVLRIHAGTVLASFVVTTAGMALLSLHRHRALVVVNTLAFAVALPLVLVLGDARGAQGGAIASVAGEMVLAAASVYALRRADAGVRVGGRVLVGALAGGLAGLLVAAVPELPSGVGLVVAPLACLAVILLLRAVPEELLAAVRRR